MEDMLGLSPRVPKFVRQFGRIGEAIEEAIVAYSEGVKAGTFPAPEHSYELKGAARARSAPTQPTAKAKQRATKKPK